MSCHHDSQSYPEYVVAFKPAGAAGGFGVQPQGAVGFGEQQPAQSAFGAAGVGAPAAAPLGGGGLFGAAQQSAHGHGSTTKCHWDRKCIKTKCTFKHSTGICHKDRACTKYPLGQCVYRHSFSGPAGLGGVGSPPGAAGGFGGAAAGGFGVQQPAAAGFGRAPPCYTPAGGGGVGAAAATQATAGATAVGHAWRQVGGAGAASIGRAVATFSYSKRFPDELSIRAGDVIEVTDLHDPAAGWWVGRLKTGKNGFFPANHVTIEDSETLRSRVVASGLNVHLLPAPINRRDLPVAAQPAAAAVTAAAAAAAASSSAPLGPDRMLPGGSAARITRMAAGMSLVSSSATIARVAADFNGFCSMVPAPMWLRLKKVSEEVYECSIDVGPEDDATVLGQLRAAPAVSTACTITLRMNFAGTNYPMAQPTVSVLTAGFVHPAVAADRTFTACIEHGWNPTRGCFPPGYNGLTLVELFLKATGLKMQNQL